MLTTAAPAPRQHSRSVGLASDGELDAFEALWRSAQPVARLLARRFLRRDELADEAAQEAFTRLWRRWPRLRHHPNLEGWVMLATFNVCREMGRRERRLTALVAVDRVATHDEAALERPELMRALSRLTERQRNAVVARHYLDLDEAAAAELLGRTPGQIRTAADEGRRALRRHLGTDDPEEKL